MWLPGVTNVSVCNSKPLTSHIMINRKNFQGIYRISFNNIDSITYFHSKKTSIDAKNKISHKHPGACSAQACYLSICRVRRAGSAAVNTLTYRIHSQQNFTPEQKQKKNFFFITKE